MRSKPKLEAYAICLLMSASASAQAGDPAPSDALAAVHLSFNKSADKVINNMISIGRNVEACGTSPFGLGLDQVKAGMQRGVAQAKQAKDSIAKNINSFRTKLDLIAGKDRLGVDIDAGAGKSVQATKQEALAASTALLKGVQAEYQKGSAGFTRLRENYQALQGMLSSCDPRTQKALPDLYTNAQSTQTKLAQIITEISASQASLKKDLSGVAVAQTIKK